MLQNIFTPYKSRIDSSVHTELRGQNNRSRRVVLLSGDIVSNIRTDVRGVSARVYKNGVWGFSSMAEYTTKAADTVLRAAAANASFMDSHLNASKPGLPAQKDGQMMEETSIHDPEQKIYVEFAKETDNYIKSHCPGLVSRRIISTEDSMEKLLITTDGLDAHTVLPRSYMYVFLSAETPTGVPVELFRPFGGEGTFDLNFTDPSHYYADIDRLYEQLMEKREGVYAQAGEKTVILGGEMTGMLAHEAVGHTVEADLVLGGSVAANCLHQPVASELVTMTDFAHTAFGERCPLPVFVDDEGTEAADVTLIRDGILTGYMNNRESALHFGMKACGNARAWMFSDEPLIRMRNTAVHPGKDKLEDMIASVDDGYYLLSSGNGQADTTGEFMFGVTLGYEIKNGKIGRALLDTTISGVAFEMLKTVDMVGNKVTWQSSGFCGKKQPMPVGLGGPALRCKVTIGGR